MFHPSSTALLSLLVTRNFFVLLTLTLLIFYPNFTYFLSFLLLLILSFFLPIPTFLIFFHSSFSWFFHSFYLSQLSLFSSIPPCPDSFILSTYPNFTYFLPFLRLLILSFFLLITTFFLFFHSSVSYLSQLYLFSSIPPCPDSFLFSPYPQLSLFSPLLHIQKLFFLCWISWNWSDQNPLKRGVTCLDMIDSTPRINAPMKRGWSCNKDWLRKLRTQPWTWSSVSLCRFTGSRMNKNYEFIFAQHVSTPELL